MSTAQQGHSFLRCSLGVPLASVLKVQLRKLSGTRIALADHETLFSVYYHCIASIYLRLWELKKYQENLILCYARYHEFNLSVLWRSQDAMPTPKKQRSNTSSKRSKVYANGGLLENWWGWHFHSGGSPNRMHVRLPDNGWPSVLCFRSCFHFVGSSEIIWKSGFLGNFQKPNWKILSKKFPPQEPGIESCFLSLSAELPGRTAAHALRQKILHKGMWDREAVQPQCLAPLTEADGMLPRGLLGYSMDRPTAALQASCTRSWGLHALPYTS